MYRTRDLWEEAFRVAGECRQQPELRKQVAFLWAKHLGSDSAVRLLNRLGLLHTAIDYATEHCAFEFAFDLARSCPAEKVAEVHNKYAMFLEDEGKLSEAEEQFIKVLFRFTASSNSLISQVSTLRHVSVGGSTKRGGVNVRPQPGLDISGTCGEGARSRERERRVVGSSAHRLQ